jgi:hypothetical protein
VSTVAVVVVVVGACIGVVTSMMTRTLEPATKRPAHERGPDPEADDDAPVDEVEDAVEDVDDVETTDVPVEPVAAPPPPPERSEPLPPGVRPPSIRAARALLASPPPTAPAPARARRVRPRPLPRDEGVPHRPTRWWERLRSLVALTTVSVVLGLLAAVAVGVAMVALFSLLRSAVG